MGYPDRVLIVMGYPDRVLNCSYGIWDILIGYLIVVMGYPDRVLVVMGCTGHVT